MKTLFSQGASHTTRLFIAAVMSCVLMFIDNHQHHLEGLRKAIGAFITPIVYVADIPGDFFAWSGEKLMTRSQLRQENSRLKSESLILKAQLQKFVALQAENARLRNLLGNENKSIERRLVAEIIQIDSDPFSLRFLINKGSMHDIFVGQTVIDAKGIVGQVVEVSPATARVLMISDVTHAIPVRVNRNGVRSTVVGTGQLNLLALQFVPETTDIKVGDLLLSSGLGQRFPDGYPVGTVTSVQRDPGQDYVRIFASPAARLERNALVLLVWPEKKVESN
ncbi:rod shape-determining protein MreC [Aliikangiella coralliicola]|uniref:Cell shape-determining protein MreC n=1 Tax=Aliikangiella coralliicola TaxID=2592383 RepID=A0A545UB31_9GAMM|nr:rod shape-determining protein MreC [Aliikangiella coralliicola]TQV86670.1 rod shape-determining protein MreC [Aliikangiella coralliicola]